MQNPMSSWNRYHTILLSILIVLYVATRAISSPLILEKPRILADTAAYVRISLEPASHIDFWAGSRPPAFPLLLKVAARNYNEAAALQLSLSIAAWCLLGLTVTRLLTPPGLRLAALVLVLLFSLDRHIASWDFVMMTESLSLTALALFLACALWLSQGWTWTRVAAFLGSGFLLAFTRDTNAWMLLALAGLIAAAVALRWWDVKALVLVTGLSVTFLLSNASATIGERWLFPLGNVITQRILPRPSALQYFESCGMPVSPALLQLSGKYANSDDQAMFAGSALQPFRYWLRDHGKACYVGWLLANPASAVEETLYETGGLAAFPTVDRFFSNRYTSLLPAPVAAILYPERFTLWIWGFSTLAALIAVCRRLWRANPLWGVFACMILLILPHLFLTWHGDAMAPERHALSVGVQLYLGSWILLILLVERWLRGKSAV
jgi:hypothetical protein